jgi:hypothetical protein
MVNAFSPRHLRWIFWNNGSTSMDFLLMSLINMYDSIKVVNLAAALLS